MWGMYRTANHQQVPSYLLSSSDWSAEQAGIVVFKH
jgi:hypothetical protein